MQAGSRRKWLAYPSPSGRISNATVATVAMRTTVAPYFPQCTKYLAETATCYSKLPEPTASEGREEEEWVSAAAFRGAPPQWLPRYKAALKSGSRPSEPRT